MKKYFLLLSILSLATVSCNKEAPASGGGDTPAGPALVRIDPIITKVTPSAFEQGDAIGVAIRRTAGVWAENAKLTYDGMVFFGEQKWYEQADDATLAAYYPYAETFPATFSVALDQSKGTASSDLLTAVKSGVLPTAAPVSMMFSRQMCTLVVNVTNNTEGEVTEMTLCGTKPRAVLDETLKASVDEESVEADIVMYKVSDTQYQALVVPQTTTLFLQYKLDGEQKSKDFDSVELTAGGTQTLSLVIEEEGVFEEHLDENYFIYHGARYSVMQLSNGRWIMNQSMRYVPKRKTVSDNPADGNGIWYPYTSDGTTATADKSEAAVVARGLLYDHQVAFAAEITADNFKGFEGCRGICPEGWHIPTLSEWLAICGAANSTDTESAQTLETAIYYDTDYKAGRIKTMQDDGFNFDFAGSITRNTNTVAGKYSTVVLKTTNCSVESWIGKNAVTYYMGSTPHTPANTETNRQFMSLMTTFTGTYSEGKASVAYSNYLGGYSLRCIRDAE